MSNLNNQNKDQVPIINVQYQTPKKITKEDKNEEKNYNTLISMIISAVLGTTILALGLTLVIYTWILGPKNILLYPAKNGGNEELGLIAITLIVMFSILTYACKITGSYFVKNELGKKILRLLTISFLYLTITAISAAFYATPLRYSVLTKMNVYDKTGLVLFLLTLSISCVMIILNVIETFTNVKLNIKWWNIFILAFIVWIPSFGYSIYSNKWSFINGNAYTTIVYPIIVDLGLFLSFVKLKKEQFDYSLLYVDIIVYFGLAYMTYNLFINLINNTNFIM